jgi:hypothetical protein
MRVVLARFYLVLYAFMRMAKKPLNLLVDEELVQKARDHGLVISKFLENKLQEYFSFIEAVSSKGRVDDGLSRIRTGDLRRVKATS